MRWFIFFIASVFSLLSWASSKTNDCICIHDLLKEAWCYYQKGDWECARMAFRQAEALDSDNAEAKYGLNCIAKHCLQTTDLDHIKTRTQMLESVGRQWQSAYPCNSICNNPFKNSTDLSLEKALETLNIQKVSFNKTPLSRAIEYIGELAAAEGLRTNFIALDPEAKDPLITLTLRDLSLKRVLDYIASSISFQVDIGTDAIILRPAEGPGGEPLKTEYFPISRGGLVCLIGDCMQSQKMGPGKPRESSEIIYPSLQEEEMALRGFFERAGISFNAPGCAMAFDGKQVIATHTPRQLTRLSTLIEKCGKSYQVEIEAKFMEVKQGVLEELGFQWRLTHGSEYLQTQNQPGDLTSLRNLEQAFATKHTSNSDGIIITPTENRLIPNFPPLFPGNINLGAGAPNTANILGVFAGWDLQMIIKALEQQADSDLMSAPKVTVVSGKTAEIIVAKEFRYPECYGKIDSAVGTTASTAITGGSAGVTITAGTPQNFVTRPVGVQMEVTPVVEGDGQWISLRMEPQVTEFEGFVEYGGRSLAISSGTTVEVPSGFFQPIFSVRQIRTEVTIANGATVIMGGLAREEQKQVSDKVPILGDIPLIGQLFRSKGETTQKRSLLILVTGNVISAGGAPVLWDPCAKFEAPAIVLPQGITAVSP